MNGKSELPIIRMYCCILVVGLFRFYGDFGGALLQNAEGSYENVPDEALVL